MNMPPTIGFVEEELVNREIEIAGYLLQSLSLNQIAVRTGLSKRHLAVHIRNMEEKLGTENCAILKKIFRLR